MIDLNTRRVWYAATNDIVKMGPYVSDIAAWAALRRASGEPNMPGDRVWPELDEVVPECEANGALEAKR